MKKIFLVGFAILMVQFFVKLSAFADEIIDSKGVVIPCKIETVEAGFVEYKKDGNLYNFKREKDSAVYNDYVDVRVKLLKRHSVERMFGKVIVKDMWSVILENDNGQIDIPFYKVKFVGVYKP